MSGFICKIAHSWGKIGHSGTMIYIICKRREGSWGMTDALLIINAVSTFFMAGVIWVTQVAVYPDFHDSGKGDFGAAHNAYRVKIALIATLPMVVEALTSVLLLVYKPLFLNEWEVWAGFGFVGVIWASTFLLQVPQHERLANGFDSRAVSRLVATNWVRTGAWTLRCILVGMWLIEAMES